MKINLERLVQKKNDELIFRKYGLDKPTVLFPHPSGNIPVNYLDNTPQGKSEFVMGLRQGTHYEPETHAHAHTLIIKEGKGEISIDGEVKPYSAGDVFEVGENVPHGFVSVEDTTIVIQRSK